MKRLTAVLLALLMLCLPGCGRKTPSPEEIREKASGDFASEARVTYGDLQASLTFSREDGACTVTLTEPEQVKGLSFLFTDRLLTVTYNGISFELAPDSLPAQAVAGAMVSAVNAVLEPFGIGMEVGEDAVELSGDAEAGRFLLRLDPETGSYLSVEIPEKGFAAEFENFRFF